MKLKQILFLLLLPALLTAQNIPFNYSVKIKPVTIAGFPGLHSFAVAQSGGKWLIIGGRTDGLHARQPFNAFQAADNNTSIYVVDVNAQQFWSAPLNTLAVPLQEQLQSTNTVFYQDADSLYIIGGYAYSNTAADHITFPNMTSVAVTGLINAVISGSTITPYFKQITDTVFAVSGAQLGKIGQTFYLVGGHRFDGRYNPMGNPTYTQTYTDGIRKFSINNSGSQLSYSNYSVITDQVHLHRRDYNLVPQVFPNGDDGYLLSSGVFQVGIDLPFLYPVEITAAGYTPVTTFSQYLSNYHSATTALYDSTSNTMHSLFFGGMSQYTIVNNTLVQDNNVPFVKTISRLSRDSNGLLEEHAFPNEMPVLIGASSEFILNQNLSHYQTEIIKLAALPPDSALAGHICGGIYSTQTNPFTNNNTGVTSAHPVIYEVWLINNPLSVQPPLDGKNPLELQVFPNPAESDFKLRINLPYKGNMDVLITDINGRIVAKRSLFAMPAGLQVVPMNNGVNLPAGVYQVNVVFDGRFCARERLVITE